MNEAVKKAGKIGGGCAMAVLCYGDFKDGLGNRHLADALIYSDGHQNQLSPINNYATIMDVCRTQESLHTSHQRK